MKTFTLTLSAPSGAAIKTWSLPVCEDGEIAGADIPPKSEIFDLVERQGDLAELGDETIGGVVEAGSRSEAAESEAGRQAAPLRALESSHASEPEPLRPPIEILAGVVERQAAELVDLRQRSNTDLQSFERIHCHLSEIKQRLRALELAHAREHGCR